MAASAATLDLLRGVLLVIFVHDRGSGYLLWVTDVEL